jgi:hypothetical protein
MVPVPSRILAWDLMRRRGILEQEMPQNKSQFLVFAAIGDSPLFSQRGSPDRYFQPIWIKFTYFYTP